MSESETINETIANSRAIKGALTWVKADRLRGWAFAPERPEEHLRIEVKLDGKVVGTATADVFSDKLQARAIGRGDHAFLVQTSEEIPVTEPDRLEVIATDSAGRTLLLPLPRVIGATPKRSWVGITPTDVPQSTPVTPAPVVTGVAASTNAGIVFDAVDTAMRPVFVLGSARSGTSALGRALRMNTRYMGPGEGHLLHLFPKLTKLVDRHYRNHYRDALPGMSTLIAQVPQSAMEDGVRAIFVNMARTLVPSLYWMDKTPGGEMIRSTPELMTIWPNARVIFMKRRPIENIESRRRKFPHMTFKDHCQLWADSMLAWEEVRDQLTGVSLVIEQMDMAHAPEKVVEELGPLLDLSPEERAGLLLSLEEDKPQRTTSEFAPVYTLDTVKWSAEEKRMFTRICGEVMQRFGYGTGADYSAA